MHYLFNEEITEDSVNNLVDKIESTDKEENINFGEKLKTDGLRLHTTRTKTNRLT